MLVERFDVIVVGGGAVGTAAARTLAERGRSTMLLERSTIGHASGSSGGPTRIFRYNYAQPVYVEMARRSSELWRELEDVAGVELLRVTGGLDVGAAAAACAATVEAAGMPIRRVRPGEVRERWPAVRLPGGAEVYLQEDGGVLRAAETVLAQARLAIAAGADVREEVHVAAVRTMGDAVEVHTDDDAFAAEVVVVAAGAWAPAILADAGIDVPLVPSREQVTYFALDEPEPLPTLIERWDDGVHADYAVPDPWEPGAFKVGLHQGGDAVDPSRRPTDRDPWRLARSRAHAAERFAAHHETGVVDTCLYTNTPDEDFVLDRVGPVVIASPCSGHGFKFVPLLGRVIADLATGQPSAVPLERFRVARFAT